MGKDSPSTPDYKGAAEATAASNQKSLEWQTNANRPTINTPWGSQTWSNNKVFDQAGYDAAMQKYIAGGGQGTWVEGTPDQSYYSPEHEGMDVIAGTPGHWEGADPTKAPKKDDFYKDDWTTNINLSPDQQAALDAQMKIQLGRSSAAQGLLDQATQAFQTPFGWGSLPARANAPQTRSDYGDSSVYRQKAQDAMDALLKPSLDQARQAAEARLANQGITRGSQAYEDEMRQLADNETRAHLASIGEGRNESAMMFGQDQQRNAQLYGQDLQSANFQNQNRMQAIMEEMQKRGMSLNELNALLTGQQVQYPQMPGVQQAGNAGGTNYTGALQNQYGANLDQANASNAATNNALSSAASLAAMYFMFS